ncbi:MAG TPA: hypothetical protein VJP39_03640 [Gaiellaceae bacterium]|nr:hypothetical protein [Gaiellaceae bacterium]
MKRLLLIPVAALCLAAAGCGGGSSSGIASVPSTTTTGNTTASSSSHSPLAFARCMRAHGFAGWPDPLPGGGFDKSKLRALGYTKNQVRAVADGACKNFVPNGGPQQLSVQQKVADGLSFARCMRSHGVNRFPDPTAQGQLSVQMVMAQGINVQSPQVLRVVQTCLPASHGALTPAKVERALREAGGG